MKRYYFALIALVLISATKVRAAQPDEGMWLPLYLKNMNEADMKKLGLQLSADQIYNVEQSSLKDAIIRLNNGSCTAELVSGKGLLFTNHHCAYNDVWEAIGLKKINKEKYLEEGFWSQSMDQEIGDLGISAAILNYIENITDKIYPRLEKTTSEAQRGELYRHLADSIALSIENGNEFVDAQVKEMFDGNEYYVYVYKVYQDVRIVASPPESIGKFGGDTDNWMWPRHTGDFAILRIYADANNEPSNYNANNKPFKPKHFLPISLEHKKEGDFSMIMGFPGSTERYLTSHDLVTKLKYSLPSIVENRTIVLDVMKKYMDQDSELETRLKSFRASLANGWKLWQGQMKMAEQYNLVEKQEKEDEALEAWVNADPKRKERYGASIEGIKAYNIKMRTIASDMAYYTNGFLMLNTVGQGFRWGMGAMQIKANNDKLDKKMDKAAKAALQDSINAANQVIIDDLIKRSTSYFDVSGLTNQNYQSAHPHEFEILEKLSLHMYNSVYKQSHPEFLKSLYANAETKEIAKLRKKLLKKASKSTGKNIADVGLNADVEATIAEMYGDSTARETKAIVASLKKMYASATSLNRTKAFPALEGKDYDQITNDEWASFCLQMINDYRVFPIIQQASSQDHSLYTRRYMEALMKWKKDKKFYPDANSTLRLTYGTVIPYQPRDGVDYEYLTTHKGVLEKNNPNDEEFRNSERLLEMFRNKDFGKYGHNDNLYLCFLTNHDITGGNSGSPVIDANGNLIGIAFDGNWEAATSDFLVMPNYNRTISVDIRYVLWVIEKFGNCSRLIDEMKVIEAAKPADNSTSKK